jgi:PAS domain S-box-containing protein
VGIARDITERKWVENLLRLQRDFGIFLSSTEDLGAAAERLLKVALENEGLDCGAVYLVNSQTNTLEITAHQGLSADFAKRSSRLAADPVRNRLAGARQAAPREQGEPMAGIVQQLKCEGLLALEVIPIQHSGQVVAVLNVGSRAHATIPANTRQAIEALAAQAGGAIARIRAEQSMRASRQMLEKTIHNLHAAVLIIDAHTTTIRDCNPAAIRMFGHSREEMIGQSPALLHLNEAMCEEFWRHLQVVDKEKGLLSEFEFKMKRKDGTTFSTEQNLVPIRNEAGEIVTWVGVVRDITERKTTEEDLRQLSGRIIEAQEAERQRVARELHDSVNQVIASAKMRLRKVEAHVALNPMARELLARCDDLLVQALEENRRIAHDLRPTDLDALGLADACRSFCKQFESRTNLTVKCRITPLARRCPPAVELNLFRIVQETLNNVQKHAHAKAVRLRMAFQKSGLLLKIQDDGRGFDPKAAKPVKGKGRGMGLTNMQERAAILGGTCEVVSVPNEGTTITVRVPCQAHRPLTTRPP